MFEIGQPGDIYRPRYGYEGLPGTGGFAGQMLQMAVQSFGPSMGQQLGMTPMGLTQQNPYDTLNQLRMTRMHDEFVAHAARMNQMNYEQQLRGMAATIGLPWGPDQIAASRQLATTMRSMEPMFAQMAPQLLDQLAGMRGSPTVMAEYLFRGGLLRADPVTGGRGLRQASLEQLNDALYSNMFAGTNYQQMHGFTAGQTGRLFAELQLRGQMASSFSARELPLDVLRDAAQRNGINLPQGGIDALSSQDLAKLSSDQHIGAALRAGDASRIERNLRKHVETLSVIRDLFGENGQPNAPVPELLNALTSLSGGLSGQAADQSRLANQLRTTANLARQSGVGLSELSGMSMAAQQTAASMGLGATAAPEAVRNALAFRSAYQMLQPGAVTGWDVADMRFQQDQVARLTLAATRSPAANMIGLAERLRTEMRDIFQPGSDTLNYLNAVQSGVGTFNRGGREISTNLSEAEFSRMLMESSGGQLTQGQVAAMLEQRALNREYGERVGAASYTQRVLQAQQLRSITDRAMLVPFGGAMDVRARQAGLTLDGTTRDALTRAAQAAASTSLFDMSNEDRVDNNRRNTIMAEAMRTALAQTPEGQQLLAAPGSENFLRGLAAQGFGAADVQSRALVGMGMLTAMSINDSRLTTRAGREEISAGIEGTIQQKLAGLGRGTALQRFTQGLMDVDEKDPMPVARLMAKTLGFEPTTEIQKKLASEASRLQGLRQQFEAAKSAFETEKDPIKRREAMSKYSAAAAALTDAIGTLGELGETAGLSTNATLTQTNIGRALRESNFLDIALRNGDRDAVAAGIMAEQTTSREAVDALLGDDAIKRLGTDATDRAGKLQDINERISELAHKHAGGDLGKLLSGDFKVTGDTLTGTDKRMVMSELQRLRQSRRETMEWVYTNAERAGTAADPVVAAAKNDRDTLLARTGNTVDSALRKLYGNDRLSKEEIVERVGGQAAYDRLLTTEGAGSRLKYIAGVVDENYKLREKRSWWSDPAERQRKQHDDIAEEFFYLRDSADRTGAEDPRRRGLSKLLDESLKAPTASAADVKMTADIANLTIKRDGTATLELSGRSTANMARGTA